MGALKTRQEKLPVAGLEKKIDILHSMNYWNWNKFHGMNINSINGERALQAQYHAAFFFSNLQFYCFVSIFRIHINTGSMSSS
jgi:hypothetical protein